MPLDLLGPATTNVVTTRPSETRLFGDNDTFFRPCSGGDPSTGTPIGAVWLNGIMQQIRRAIRGMGIAEDNADDDMLLKAIQKSGTGYIPYSEARARVPLYPHVAGDGLLTVNGSTGQVAVAAGQDFIHRGVWLVQTDSYAVGLRTFATLASKTYHLRWDPTNGFRLRDLADVAYNPTSALESHAAFDSSYDDMLIARIVTSAGNVPTITPLANKAFLAADLLDTFSGLSGGASAPVIGATAAGFIYFYTGDTAGYATHYFGGLNWARTPRHISVVNHILVQNSSSPPGALEGGANVVNHRAVTRYGAVIGQYSDWSAGNTFIYSMGTLQVYAAHAACRLGLSA